MKKTNLIRIVDDTGKVTLPKAYREEYGIDVGDEMEVFMHEGAICFRKKNAPLTLSDLKAMETPTPVWLRAKFMENGGYWCLCEGGVIVPPSGASYAAEERPEFTFYLNPPKWR